MANVNPIVQELCRLAAALDQANAFEITGIAKRIAQLSAAIILDHSNRLDRVEARTETTVCALKRHLEQTTAPQL